MTSDHAKNTTPPTAPRSKILIADDDAPTLMLLNTAISQWGYEILQSTNGQSAWDVIQKPHAPQLLILDWAMPRMSGIELCIRIRKELAPHYNPYIILLTQTTGSENIIMGLDAGANEFLSKPIRLAELRSRISVGEKIIRYENELNDHNAQLKDYISKVHTANNMVINASQKLDDARKATDIPQALQNNLKHFQKLDEVKSQLDNILDVFTAFQSEDKRHK